MKKIVIALFGVLLVIISLAVFYVSLSAVADAAPAMQMYSVSGPSTAATGAIVTDTASVLEFSSPKTIVIVSNESGGNACFKINDTTVSLDDHDFCLADGENARLDDIRIIKVAVVASYTAKINVRGW